MTSDYSLSDIAAAMGNDNGGLGNGAWWIIILFLFAFMNGGLGGYGGGRGVMDNYTITSDFTQLLNRLNQIGDSLGNGIADATFALNNTITNGFSQGTISGMQNTNQIMGGINEVNAGIAGVNYNMSTQFCNLNNQLQNSTRDIIAGQTANTKAILDAITQNKIEELQSKIAALTADNQALKFGASQTAQNAYLVNALKPNCCNPCYTCGA